MQRPLQITYRGMEPSEFVEARIRERAAKLERHYDRITGCQVTIDAPQKHRGGLFEVRVVLGVPDEELVVDRAHRRDPAHEDVYVAIRDSFDAAKRRLEDYVARRRRLVKTHDVPSHGRVTLIFQDDGYGFAERSDGLEVYFHENSVPGGAFTALEVGDQVRITVADGEGEKGPQASSVVPVEKHHLLDPAAH